MSSLKEQIEYSEQELRELREEQIRNSKPGPDAHATILTLEKVEKQMTELNVLMAEAARLLRSESGPDRALHRNNGSVLAALNYYEAELRELNGRVSTLVRSTLSVKIF